MGQKYAPQMPLTDTACKNAKARAKPYKLADGGGMYLEVMPNGSRYWRLKYRFGGKEKRLALGVFPKPRWPKPVINARKPVKCLRPV